MTTRTEADVKADFAALDRQGAREKIERENRELAASMAKRLRDEAEERSTGVGGAERFRARPDYLPEPLPARRAAPMHPEALAARWALFAAHALQGLLAAGDDETGQVFAEQAARIADLLLAEHDARFSASTPGVPAPRPTGPGPSPAPPPGSGSPPRGAARPPR